MQNGTNVSCCTQFFQRQGPLCEGASVSSARHSSTLQAASSELEAAEAALRLEQQQRRAEQQSFSDRLQPVLAASQRHYAAQTVTSLGSITNKCIMLHRLQALQEEREALAAQAKTASDKLQQLQQAQLEHQAQMGSLRAEVAGAREELESYKNKARHILASKEALIDALKTGAPAGADPHQTEHTSLLETELKQTRAELCLCREELAKNAEQHSRLRAELSELERCAEQESARHAAALSDAQEQLTQLSKLKEELELENRQARQEARCLQEELSRTKVQHSILLQEATKEQDALIKQLQHSVRPGLPSSEGGGQEDLQRKVHRLSEALLQKQSELDCLNTRLQARDTQLTRLQQQQQESHLLGRNQSVVSVPMEDVRSRGVPTLLVETPFDGRMTRRVKRAYTSLDRLSVSLGVFLRRHPMARILVLLYVLLLHLWVLLVLLTYTPEVHDHTYQPPAAPPAAAQHPPLPHT
ncbi:Golgin subfamily A member 5 [Trinorchestia longiramus]|nr:Golgin subfamily A member 5 [Trinorchestia longiramus]